LAPTVAELTNHDSDHSRRWTDFDKRVVDMDRHQELRLAGLVCLALIQLNTSSAKADSETDLVRLLERKTCPACKLQDTDLVRADLRDARLEAAQLQRANLSGAQLDGANLRKANLSFTSLQGATLRGADLRGAQLIGTDLRQSDLSGALLDPEALSQAHWQKAKGVNLASQSYAELHNAGVEAFQLGRQTEAERFFGEAIRKQPEAGISWVARGISRIEQGKTDLASQDLTFAANLYKQAGDDIKVQQLETLAKSIKQNPKDSKGGNGLGSQLMQGALSAFQALAPLAIKAFSGL
jgi:uncharacterized protein YjbI with pentapeptide repeats